MMICEHCSAPIEPHTRPNPYPRRFCSKLCRGRYRSARISTGRRPGRPSAEDLATETTAQRRARVVGAWRFDDYDRETLRSLRRGEVVA